MGLRTWPRPQDRVGWHGAGDVGRSGSVGSHARHLFRLLPPADRPAIRGGWNRTGVQKADRQMIRRISQFIIFTLIFVGVFIVPMIIGSIMEEILP